MALLTAYVARSSLLLLLTRFLHNGSIGLILLGKWHIFNLRLNMSLSLRTLPFLLLLQRARSNMVPFNFTLEANNLGHIFDLFLALLLVVLDPIITIGLLLDVGDKPKSSLVIWGFLHTQHIVKFGFPFMTLYQVFLQRSDLGLEIFDFLYMVSDNTSTRGSRSFIDRATRQGK